MRPLVQKLRVLRWRRQSIKPRVGGPSEPVPVRLYRSEAREAGSANPGMPEVLVRGHSSPPSGPISVTVRFLIYWVSDVDSPQ